MFFSKSKYTDFCQCPMLMWLRQHKPEVGTANASAEARARTGSEVGDLAMGYFGDYVEVTSCRDGKLDISGMIERTNLRAFTTAARR